MQKIPGGSFSSGAAIGLHPVGSHRLLPATPHSSQTLMMTSVFGRVQVTAVRSLLGSGTTVHLARIVLGSRSQLSGPFVHLRQRGLSKWRTSVRRRAGAESTNRLPRPAAPRPATTNRDRPRRSRTRVPGVGGGAAGAGIAPQRREGSQSFFLENPFARIQGLSLLPQAAARAWRRQADRRCLCRTWEYLSNILPWVGSCVGNNSWIHRTADEVMRRNVISILCTHISVAQAERRSPGSRVQPAKRSSCPGTRVRPK